mmetsp:Transcript_89977/g.263004  ORF Transcript_89977/g.263004 Transcript_89977/m.263004 type:complete len:618 (+) Transcript_89977:56-1909(+)
MLPTLSSLARERSLLQEVLRRSSSEVAQAVAAESEGRRCPAEHIQSLEKSRQGPYLGGSGHCPVDSRAQFSSARRRCRSLPEDRTADKEAVKGVAGQLNGKDCLQDVPQELLAGIAEHYLDSPVWHSCQLGEASSRLGEVFMDEMLWHGFLDLRFREASRNPRRQALNLSRSPSPSARLSYAHLHTLEARFREGLYGAHGTLDNPRKGVAVMDLRLAPSDPAAGATTAAFAALRDGSIMVYALDPSCPPGEGGQGSGLVPDSMGLCPGFARVAPLRELTPRFGESGPAICCLPLESPNAVGAGSGKHLLVAGYALGRLGAWELPAGQSCTPAAWSGAHAGRVASLAVLGHSASLLSASADSLLKAWCLDSERFGTWQRSFLGHRAAVVSVATSPHDGNIFLSGGHDRTMRLWDVRQAGDAAALWQQQDWVTCVDFHPTCENRAMSSDKSVHWWDLRMAGGRPQASTHRHRKLVSKFRVDPLRLASCSLDGSVKVSSLEEPSVRVASPHASPHGSPQLSPKDSPETQPSSPPQLPAGALECSSGDVCTLRTSSDYILSIDFDATRLLAGGVDGQVDVYDFSDAGNFSRSSPDSSPNFFAAQDRSPPNIEMTGLDELEI